MPNPMGSPFAVDGNAERKGVPGTLTGLPEPPVPNCRDADVTRMGEMTTYQQALYLIL